MSVYRGFIRTDKRDPLGQDRMMIYRHDSNLTVTVVPKPGFVHRFVAFGIPYGAADLRFSILQPPDQERDADGWSSHLIEVPPGTAHFLEHCVFSRDEDGGLINRLAALGAKANAYTTYTSTVYYLTCVDNVTEALSMFYDALMHPVLDDARVDGERSIIQSELALYMDDPDSRAYRSLMNALYRRSGITEDISGSSESIDIITAADLRAVAEHFYIPSALDIVLTGNYHEDEVTDILNILADSLESLEISPAGQTVAPYEPPGVEEKVIRLESDVGNSSYLIGFKNARISPAAPVNGGDLVLNQLIGQLYFETLVGEVSELYQTLYDEGIVNDSFSIQYICEADFAYLILGSEADDPAAASRALTERLLEASRSHQLDEYAFEIQKSALAGSFLRSLDSVESCGMAAINSRLNNVDLFDYTSIFSLIQFSKVHEAMDFITDENSCATVLTYKKVDKS